MFGLPTTLVTTHVDADDMFRSRHKHLRRGKDVAIRTSCPLADKDRRLESMLRFAEMNDAGVYATANFYPVIRLVIWDNDNFADEKFISWKYVAAWDAVFIPPGMTSHVEMQTRAQTYGQAVEKCEAMPNNQKVWYQSMMWRESVGVYGSLS